MGNRQQATGNRGGAAARCPLPAAAPYYYTADMLPPMGIVVRVVWDGRGPFEAARVMKPAKRHQRTECWLTHHHGEAVFLPEGGPGFAPMESDQPQIWQPLSARHWSLPLPERTATLMPDEGRMWSSRQSFGAVDDAEASDLAKEMENDRHAAGSHREGGIAGGDPTEQQRGARRKLWWRDATLVKYSAPGRIVKREAEARIMRYLAGEDLSGFIHGAGLHRRPFGLSDDDLRALADLEGSRLADAILRFDPLPQDFADEETAGIWFAALGLEGGGRARQRVLIFASRDLALSFAEIGSAAGVSRARAHQIYGDAIERVWAIANGERTAGIAKRDAAIERIRIGNRQHRQRERA